MLIIYLYLRCFPNGGSMNEFMERQSHLGEAPVDPDVGGSCQDEVSHWILAREPRLGSSTA